MTIANGLSVLRIGLAPVLLVLASQGAAHAFTACLALALLTDIADGKIARWLGQASPLGARLDTWGDLLLYLSLPVCGALTAPRWRFAILARLLPGVDAERVWTLRDLSEPLPGEVLLERRIASVLARVWPLVVAGVMLVFVAGLVLVWGVGPRLRHPAAPFVAGLVVHGLFILVAHEAAHGNLLGRPADDWLR